MEFPIKVGILIFDGVGMLSFSGPLEVFTLAGSKHSPTPGAFEVHLIAPTADAITARGGARVLPTYTVAECPPLELLLVPGGPGVEQTMQERAVIDWLTAVQPRFALASCRNGALLLAEAGRLRGCTVTADEQSCPRLGSYQEIALRPEARFVDHGTVLTSSGLSASLDMALHLVERFVGQESAQYVTRVMEYEHRATTPTP